MPSGRGHRSWMSRRSATGCPTTWISGIAGDVRARIPGDATKDAALAFDYHCSVFKEPRPDGRPTRGRRRSSSGHPLRCREVWCGKERPCQPARAGTPAPASGPIILWAKPFIVKRLSPRDRSRAGQPARIRTQDRRPSRRRRPSTSSGVTSSDGSVTRSSSR
jgi:hypothetical protein